MLLSVPFYKGNCDVCRINFLSIPDENFEDHSAPPSPEEKDSGFFMLRKDSERRATLHRILTEDQDKVVRNLMESLAQVNPFPGASFPKGYIFYLCPNHLQLSQMMWKAGGSCSAHDKQTYPRGKKKANPTVGNILIWKKGNAFFTAFLNIRYF